MTSENPRERLFNYLDAVLRKAEEKFSKNHSTQDLQLKWGRLIIQSVVAYGKLLDTEELEQRVEKLEAQIKDAVVIPNKNH